MKKILTIITGFVHDFAAGCWGATVFVVYWLNREEAIAQQAIVLTDLKKQFFYMGILCVVIVFMTGAGRSFTYVAHVYGEDAERLRKRMLILKHIFLFVIFGLGIYWQYKMVFD